LKYGVGEQIAAGGFTLLSTETCGGMSSGAHTFLKSLTDAAMSSAAAGSEVTVTAFRASALHELSVALTRGNVIGYCQKAGEGSLVFMCMFIVVMISPRKFHGSGRRNRGSAGPDIADGLDQVRQVAQGAEAYTHL
jgi:hypothetical protein